MSGNDPTPGVPDGASPAQMVARRLERARMLMDTHRHDLAAKEIGEALTVVPEHPEAHGLLGYCLARLGQAERAHEEAAEAVRLAPDRAYMHSLRGATLIILNRMGDARAALREALRLNPDEADTHGLLAEVERLEGFPLEALIAAEAGLAIDPENATCSIERMLALRALGHQEQALAAATDMLRRDPDHATAHACRGWLLLHEDPRAAVQHFRAALRTSPDYGWARSGLVEALKVQFRAYRLVHRFEPAAVLFDAVLWMNPRIRPALPAGAARNSIITWVALLSAPFIMFSNINLGNPTSDDRRPALSVPGVESSLATPVDFTSSTFPAVPTVSVGMTLIPRELYAVAHGVGGFRVVRLITILPRVVVSQAHDDAFDTRPEVVDVTRLLPFYYGGTTRSFRNMGAC